MNITEALRQRLTQIGISIPAEVKITAGTHSVQFSVRGTQAQFSVEATNLFGFETGRLYMNLPSARIDLETESGRGEMRMILLQNALLTNWSDAAPLIKQTITNRRSTDES